MGSDNSGTWFVSVGLDFVPIFCSVKCMAESISGRDIITGTELKEWERSLSAAGAIPGFQGLRYLAKSTKYGSNFYK